MRFGFQRSHRFVSVLLAFTFALAPIAPVAADEEVELGAVVESEEAEFEAAHSEGCQGVVWIDLPRPGENITVPTSQVAGWALDANETFASGVDAIRVTLGRPGTPGALELAAIGTGIPRPDVDTHWQRADLRAGYSALVDWFRLPAGPQTIFVNGRTHCGWVEASVNVNIAAPPPAPPTSISINDVSGTVSDVGDRDRDFNFTVTLSQASTQTVTVQYRTEDGTATTSDYSSTSGTLTFSAGETSKTISVRVFGRRSSFDRFDRELTFFVRLSNPTNATIADGEGVGRIRSSSFGDGFGDVFVSTASCSEGSVCSFTLSRSGSTTGSFSVSVSTRNGTATGGLSCSGGFDYIEIFRTVFFSSGQFSERVDVSTCTDAVSSEGSETFFLRAGGREGTGTITDGTGGGTISVNSPTCPEGAPGTSTCTFIISVSSGSATFTYSTTNGTAEGVAGCPGAPLITADYVSIASTAGSATSSVPLSVPVTICGDDIGEGGSQTFTLNITSVSGATPSSLSGTATITEQ